MPAADNAAPVLHAEAARLFANLAPCPALVLAVSGGPDSTALLALVARWRDSLPDRRPVLLAVTIDHGLRPQSAAEATTVSRLAAGLGVPHRILHWTGAKPASGLQEAARDARYRLLAAAAQEAGARHVLTGHTRDDQAETVLMRLARGSGPSGLAGMARMAPLPGRAARDLILVRPFLDVSKARLIATLQAGGVAFAEDLSNHDPRFTRVRLRGLMPALEAEGLDAARLALLARRLARAEAALEAATDKAFARSAMAPGEPGRFSFDASAFGALPREIALRLLGRAIAGAGEGPVELAKLEALAEALCGAPPSPRPRFRRTLAGALVTREAGLLAVERAPPRRDRRAGPEAGGVSTAPAAPPIVKEIGAIPLADGVGGPKLGPG